MGVLHSPLNKNRSESGRRQTPFDSRFLVDTFGWCRIKGIWELDVIDNILLSHFLSCIIVCHRCLEHRWFDIPQSLFWNGGKTMSSKHHINSQAKSSPAGSDLENPMAAQPDGKSTNEQRPSYLDIPFQSTFARASDTFSASDRSSRKSSDDHGNDVRTSDFLSVPGHLRSRSQSPAPNPPGHGNASVWSCGRRTRG